MSIIYIIIRMEKFNNKSKCKSCEKLMNTQNIKKHMTTHSCLKKKKTNRLSALAKDDSISSDQFMKISVNVMRNKPLDEIGFYSYAFLELLQMVLEKNAPK
jgi:acetyl-CoA carboxylase beta subunit